MERNWQPILAGDQASRAWAAIDEIAGALSRIPDADLGDPTLAGGTAGLALLFAYLSNAQDGRGHEVTSARFLDRAQESLSNGRRASAVGLYVGFSGVAWVTEHVTGEPQDAIDEHVAAYLSATPWAGSHDLISGLAGIGVWALSALPRPGAAECLRLVCLRLVELARPGGCGVTWWTPPALLVEDQRLEHPDGYENVGVAHGTPAVIAVLAQACVSGALDGELQRRVLDTVQAGVARMISLAIPEEPARYPAIAGDSKASRLAWCYGDPGVAAALAVAASALDKPMWHAEAEATALQAARVATESSGIRDAGLCHGASGLGLLFARFHQYFGHEMLAAASRRWFDTALNFRRPGEYVGGFSEYTLDGHAACWDWLSGAAGIAQALLAAVSNEPPAWDRVLLASACPFRA